MAEITVMRQGAQKSHPFTIVIIANPLLENPLGSSSFIPDPIMNDRSSFNSCANYIDSCLFGSLPNQAEICLGHPDIGPHIRVLSIFANSPIISQANSLVANDNVRGSSLLVARRSVIVQFLAQYGVTADVVFAVSASAQNTRASAWYTTDDDSSSGAQFTLDGVSYWHRQYCVIPGMIAIHCSATSVTAFHEFSHAISSYTNGGITDLYVDSSPDLNCKRGRPIPAQFATYKSSLHQSDPNRDSLGGYPSNWTSYHCAPLNGEPALMDNYWKARTVPEACRHDSITGQFIFDRITAKINR
jgi:hypothetical protein